MHIFSRTYGIGARPYNPVEAGSFSAPPLYWNRRTLHHTVVMLRHLYSYPIIHKGGAGSGFCYRSITGPIKLVGPLQPVIRLSWKVGASPYNP